MHAKAAIVYLAALVRQFLQNRELLVVQLGGFCFGQLVSLAASRDASPTSDTFCRVYQESAHIVILCSEELGS